MEELKIFKCKTCGEPLDMSTAKDGVLECKYCATIYTLPKKETSPEALAFLRIGEHNLDTANWDGAISAYKKACEKDSNEPEAYWGMALASYKVQYIKDVVNNRLQPICHEISTRKFTESKDYQKALTLATPTQKAEYEKKATEIDYIKEEFYKLKQSGLDFDSFICVKVTDENGGKTEDYKDAEYIYDLLKGKGYSPFFSERSIRNRTGADYEAMILYALYSAETMLVVCRNEEYLQTPWVKNEYTRFLRLVNDEEKESDAITFVYYETPVERLPGRNGKLQGIDFSRRDADGKILDFVERHTPEARARREELKRKKAEEELKKQEEAKAQAQRIKELEEQLNKLNSASNTGLGSLSMEQMFAQFKEMERKQAEEAKRKAEEEARLKAEEEARKKEEEQKRLAEEARKKAEEQAKKEAELARQKAEEAKRKAEEARKKEEEQKRLAEEARKQAEEKRRIEEEVRQKAEEEKKNVAKQPQSTDDFEIENGVLKKYKGKGGDVVIPDGIIAIGDSAFFYRVSLKSITIPNSVTSIGELAFRDCRSLTNITIPNSVTSIGESAFWGCSNLLSVSIPNSVTSIGICAFYGCRSLTSVTIPNSVTSISSGMLQSCDNLTSIILPNSITSIGGNAFNGCSSLASVAIPDSVKEIGDYVFRCCSKLTSVTIPNSVTSIGYSAFSGCISLTSITIGNSVKSIGYSAFAGCYKLIEVKNLSPLKIKAGSWNYGDLERHAKRVYREGKSYLSTDKDGYTIYDDGKDKILVCYTGTQTDLTLPSGITEINRNAFYNCCNLTSITIPNSVKCIRFETFKNCTGLTNITIPNSVKIIDRWAFEGCNNLTSVTMPKSLKDIRKDIFPKEILKLFSKCKFIYT